MVGTQLAIHEVDGSDAGLAGGLVNTSQQIGAALGLVVLTTTATAPTAELEKLGVSAADAATAGFSWVFLGGAVLAVAGAVVALALRSRRG
ncbi:hypothetical protein CLV54_2888 [Compostimonas suwonensis]|uniref:MFS transporter n=2 Tax=Compostimonas suwonensis TaxID=1048394 RepID=A0A2M9BC81_9MICO|nr:hypothetical protein CLV54_2888 [Compostimonas suwonensis]